MAPFGDTVGLVDGDTGDVPSLQIFNPTGEHQPLGRDVEQLVLAAMKPAKTGARFLGAEGRVEKRRGNAAGLKRIDLVLHKGDERGNHDREAVAGERGELETERLAAARGQEGKDIFADQISFDDFALERAEGGVAERGLEELWKSGHADRKSSGRRGTEEV